MQAQQDSPGSTFARALGAKDFEQLRKLIKPDVDFRGLTPRRSWEASDVDTLVEEILQAWFEESDKIESVESVEVDSFADRERVGYRFAVVNPEGRFLVEQQAYLSTDDGQIDWLRIVCSGFRPV